jgi:CheY-like chemotaxis protein
MSTKILYFEDNFVNAQFLQRGLKKVMPMHVSFHLAQDGKEGLAMTQDIQPDIIIMDLHMPGMDGLTALKHLKSLDSTKHIPVIILTADVVSDILSEAQRCGAYSVLSKPISLRLLRHTIEQALGLLV